mmetsp:Transcript_94147/g.196462  ORF Transcript_94147/g.196462 Transcript_94147/m.196462 type:complete len:501 (+) Transcript_94147:131-1633(+)
MAGQTKRKQDAASGSKKKPRQEVDDDAPDPDNDEDWEGDVEECEDEEEEEDALAADAEGAEEEEADAAEEEAAAGAAGEEPKSRVWRPGVDQIQDGEHLDVEPGAYHMLHRAQVEWPCLSFDVLRDELGAHRTAYPMTAYVVAGTQARNEADNRLYMMKWSNLRKTAKDGKDSDEEDDDDDDEEDEDSDDEEKREAKLEYEGVIHPGGVNRVRSMPQAPHVVASWADTGKVYMWNLQAQRRALDKTGEKATASSVKPIHTCTSHKEEGFAMDFNPHETGKFLSGSNDGVVMLWEPVKGGWSVNSEKPFNAHPGSSVEDVQWRRVGTGCESIFASCSADRSVKVWDIREKSRKKASISIKEAHSSDVNVISWSPIVGELLATASDDGGFKVWDTRNVSAGAMANFLWHRKPLTSIDWHPSDETVLAVSSEDNSLSVWDMAVEDDRPEGQEDVPGEAHFPAQLLFLHMGQQDIKELKWHPQLPGVCCTTSASGFNIFKASNM